MMVIQIPYKKRLDSGSEQGIGGRRRGFCGRIEARNGRSLCWGTDAIVKALAHVDQLNQVVVLVESYPNLTCLINHHSHADPNETPGKPAFARYADLAEYGTVYAKISEIQHRSEETYLYKDMHNHVRWLLDTFGRERLVWEADYPNVSDEATYEECVTWLSASMS